MIANLIKSDCPIPIDLAAILGSVSVPASTRTVVVIIFGSPLFLPIFQVSSLQKRANSETFMQENIHEVDVTQLFAARIVTSNPFGSFLTIPYTM